MNRRGFLAALASALVIDPERLLWVPGWKSISIPRPSPMLAVGDIVLFRHALMHTIALIEYTRFTHDLRYSIAFANASVDRFIRAHAQQV